MKVSVAAAKGLNQEITVTVPHKDVQPKVDAKLTEFSKTARLPGFRPGKVPLRLFKQKYGKAVRQEVLSEVIQDSYPKALEKESINPAGMPQIEIIKDKDGEDFEYKAKFEIMPTVSVKGLSKINVEKVTSDITAKDVDNTIETMRKQFTEWEKANRACKTGDKVKIDFAGSVDGKAFEGGTSKGFELELGAGNMIPGFEDGITGMKAGETKTIKVTFPKEYHAKELASKKAAFEIKLHEVLASKLPEVNKDFAKKFNVDSVDALKKDVKANMARELEFALKRQLKDSVFEGLLTENKIDLPSAMVHQESHTLKKQFLTRMGIQDENAPQAQNIPTDMFKEQAEKRVALGLLVAEIIESQKIKADKKRMDDMMQKMASVYEDEKAAMAEYKSNPQQRTEIEQAVIEEQVIEYIMSRGKFTEVKKSFTDVMNPPAPKAEKPKAKAKK